jgi:hypothetical protein
VVFAEGADTPPVVERVTRFRGRGISFRRLLGQAWNDLWRR